MGKKFMRNSTGSATIEAVVGFTCFLFTFFTILTVVNYCRAQALISNAVDTAAKELSQYSYFYEMSGLNKIKKTLNENSEVGADNLNQVVGMVDSLYGSIAKTAGETGTLITDVKNAASSGDIDMNQLKTDLGGIKSAGGDLKTNINKAQGQMGDITDNPMKYVKSIIAVAGNEVLDLGVSHYIAAPLARSMTMKHFGSTTSEANKTLEALGVVDGINGLNFNMSTIFAAGSAEEIHIVVYYKLNLITFFKGVDFVATCSKAAVARAWLGGDTVLEKIKADESVDVAPDQEKPKESDGTSNPSEDGSAEKVDTTGSLYYQINGYTGKGVFADIYPKESNIGGATTLIWRNENRVTYGFNSTTDASKLEEFMQRSGSASFVHNEINRSEQLGQQMLDAGKINDDGRPYNGLKPDSTDTYHMTIFVPDNIDQSKPGEKEKIEQVLQNAVKEYEKEGLNFEYDIIVGGGNYDYSKK